MSRATNFLINDITPYTDRFDCAAGVGAIASSRRNLRHLAVGRGSVNVPVPRRAHRRDNCSPLHRLSRRSLRQHRSRDCPEPPDDGTPAVVHTVCIRRSSLHRSPYSTSSPPSGSTARSTKFCRPSVKPPMVLPDGGQEACFSSEYQISH